MENDTTLPVETKHKYNEGSPNFCLVCVVGVYRKGSKGHLK